MYKNILYSGIIAIIFVTGIHAQDIKEEEIKRLERTVKEAKQRIQEADIYKWNDVLRFLPDVSVARRAPYQDYTGPSNETYISASIQLNKIFDVSDLADKRKTEKRKAIRIIDNLQFTILKLIERKYLIQEQIQKLGKIVKGTDDIMEAAAKQEQIDKLKVQVNELLIEIEKNYYEIETTVIEVEG